MQTIQRVWLHFYKPAVNSDKVYVVDVAEADGFFSVRFGFGRRNNTLQVGWKVQRVSRSQALRVAERMVASKQAKGYERTDESWYVALPELPQIQKAPRTQAKRPPGAISSSRRSEPSLPARPAIQKPKKAPTKAEIEAESIAARLFEIGVSGDEREAAEAVGLSARLRQLESAWRRCPGSG